MTLSRANHSLSCVLTFQHVNITMTYKYVIGLKYNHNNTLLHVSSSTWWESWSPVQPKTIIKTRINGGDWRVKSTREWGWKVHVDACVFYLRKKGKKNKQREQICRTRKFTAFCLGWSIIVHKLKRLLALVATIKNGKDQSPVSRTSYQQPHPINL